MPQAKEITENIKPLPKSHKITHPTTKRRILTRNDIAWYSRRFRDDPYGFVVCIIGAQPTREQTEVLQAMKTNPHISIRSGHGIGKSTLFSWAILWFLSTHSGARIPCTAPTANQLYDVLWAEIAKWHSQMNYVFRKEIVVRSKRVHLKGAPQEAFAVAKVARKNEPEALSGIHAGHLLYILEEASGIIDETTQAVEGSLTKDTNLSLMGGNPIRRSGYFYDSHHGDKHLWKTFHFNSETAELVDPNYPARMAQKYGKSSNIYKVRVKGEFSTFDADQIIDLEWLEMAALRDIEIPDAREIWGLDVARFGDDKTSLTKRKGRLLKLIKRESKRDTMYIVGMVVNEWNETDKYERPDKINVDTIGLGAGVADRLREIGLPAVDVCVSWSPMDTKAFRTLRDELWFKLRDWLKDDEPSIPNDSEFIGQCSEVKYTFNSFGQKIAESKESMKKRNLPSPDDGDSVCLTFYDQNEVPIYF